uniref:Uncharacterized protein n=1 Tax=Solanum tuberosum TaxID=4113 RepID=M1D7Y4_SOLTU
MGGFVTTDHSASLVGITDQLDDSPFGVVHRHLGPSFSIVVLWVIGLHADHSTSLVGIVDQLDDSPFGVVHRRLDHISASSYSGSLGDMVLLRGTFQRCANCSLMLIVTNDTILRYEYCVAEDRSAKLVEIADELGNPPFNQLIAFSVLPSASSYSGSLGVTVLLRGTNRRLADCSFPRLSIHFLQGFAYWNKGRCMSIRQLAKLDSAIRRLSFLVLFSPFCSVLRLSVMLPVKLQIAKT